VKALKALVASQTWESFCALRKLCGGFAAPMTFVSFADPQNFPMVDQKIAGWWKRFPDESQFAWTGKIIAPHPRSRQAYLAWAEFCRRQAAELSELNGTLWRARDVEMAVWTDD
jgi:hypothetical protein